MKDYKKRVVDEKAELDAKIDKLRTFLLKEMEIVGDELDGDELDMLTRQEEVMSEYSKMLDDRIKAF